MATTASSHGAVVPVPVPGDLVDGALDAFVREKALPSLVAGKVIAVPTDTIYGLCCASQSDAAVAQLYAIKGRDADKPVAICVPTIADVARFAQLTVSEDLLRALLPGPVTLCFTRAPLLNPRLNPSAALVGIRIPDNAFIRALARAAGAPLALTSANASGAPSALLASEFAYLWPQLAAVFDAGDLGATAAGALTREVERGGSTVVDLSVLGRYRIIRPGSAEAATTATLRRFGLEQI